MSRSDGFTTADVDSGLMTDPKIVALVRVMRADGQDEGTIWTTVGLFVATILMSWREGRRVTLAEAQPAWSLVPIEPVIAALAKAKLVDAEGRVREASWQAWAGAAIERRDTLRELARRGGLRSGEVRREAHAEAHAEASGSTETKRTLKQVVEARARDGSGQDRDTSTTTNDDDDDLRAREAERFASDEAPALAWLAQHHATVMPSGNGYHRRIVQAVARHGADKVVAAFEQLRTSGADTDRQYVLGMGDILDPLIRAAPKPIEDPEMRAAREMQERVEARRAAKRANGGTT